MARKALEFSGPRAALAGRVLSGHTKAFFFFFLLCFYKILWTPSYCQGVGLGRGKGVDAAGRPYSAANLFNRRAPLHGASAARWASWEWGAAGTRRFALGQPAGGEPG